MKKKVFAFIPFFIIGAIGFYLIKENMATGRKIADNEQFLTGKWVKVAYITKNGKIERAPQKEGKFLTRKDNGIGVNNYNNTKRRAVKWCFIKKDSLYREVNNGNPSDSVSWYKLRMLSPETLVLLSQKDSTQYIQMKYTGKAREFFVGDMIDHGLWPTLGYKPQ